MKLYTVFSRKFFPSFQKCQDFFCAHCTRPSLRWDWIHLQNYTALYVHDVPQEDGKISVVEVLNNNPVVITLIGVYLPYFYSESTPLYSETLDKLHGIIQNITAPFIQLENINAQMPHTAQLSSQWYKGSHITITVCCYMTLCAITKWPVPTSNTNNLLITHTSRVPLVHI